METMIIIDEDNNVRQGLVNLFDHFLPELKISVAGSGKQVMQMDGILKPAYILMDISFDDINGLELLYTLRSRYQDTCILVFTEKDFPEYREACFEKGANFFFSKLDNPVSDLLILVTSHLHSKHVIAH